MLEGQREETGKLWCDWPQIVESDWRGKREGRFQILLGAKDVEGLACSIDCG